MAYSIDLRERVVNFVKNGGSKAQAARKYEVSRWCVFENLSQMEDIVNDRCINLMKQRSLWAIIFFLLLLYTKDATGHDIIVLRGFSPRERFQRFLMTHCPPLHERYI